MWLHIRAMDACGISAQLLLFINIFVVFINIFSDATLFKKVGKIQKILMIHTVRWSPFPNTGWKQSIKLTLINEPQPQWW